jgi:ABC-type lipoprotein release transport system permease subunit
MIKSYFQLAIRHLLKNKSFSIINIIGLAILIAYLTIIFQALKASGTNPVEALKYE